MKTSPKGIALIKFYEDCRLVAYPDPKTGGAPWTIGWGHTGPEVKKGMQITQYEADRLFLQDLAEFEAGVMRLVKVKITQGMFDALVSFAYNCGLDEDADTKAEGLGDSTLLKLVNAGKFKEAALEFGKWISKGTNVEKGLRARRAKEVTLFLEGL